METCKRLPSLRRRTTSTSTRCPCATKSANLCSSSRRFVRYDQLAEAAAEGLPRRVAKNASELPVHADDPIIHARQGDSLRRLFEQLIEEGPLLLKPIDQRGQKSQR